MWKKIPARCSLIHHFLEESSVKYPQKTALIHDETRATFTEINTLANSLARRLIDLGVSRGDRTVMILNNGLEYAVAYYGVLKAGSVAVSLGTDLKGPGLTTLLNEIEPKVIISSARFESVIREADLSGIDCSALILHDPKMDWSDYPVNTISLEEILSDPQGQNPDLDISTSDMAVIIYTSGSTGEPKGAMLTHHNILSNTDSICQYLDLTEKDRQMVVLPFFYVMGKSLLNTHFAVGGSVVINNKSAYPAAVISQMIEEEVTGFSGVPSTFAYLLHRSPLAKSRDMLKHLRYCSQAGGHMARHIKEELRRVLPGHTDIFIMYGATEASARLSYLPPDLFESKIDSIGRAIPGVTLSVLDNEGNTLPPGEVGELVAAGDNIMMGYWKDPELSARILDDRGYHTGDMACMDEDGCFYIKGRNDDMLKVSGHRINPQEIEDAIVETGLIVEAAVIGLPDELKGIRLIAVATPVERDCTGETLKEMCLKKMPRHKVPEKFIFTRSLPKKVSGKIDRGKCRDIASQ